MRKFGLALIFFMSLGIAQAQQFDVLTNWVYVPVDEAFAKQVQTLLESKTTWSEAARLVLNRRKKAKTVSEESEARLALAQLCLKVELRLCAYHFAIQTAEKEPGSQAALQAFEILQKIVLGEGMGEEPLESLVNAGGFRQVPASLAPMMHYFVARGNLKKQAAEWSVDALKKVERNSIWGLWLQLDLMEEELRRKASPEVVIEKSETLLGKLQSFEGADLLRRRVLRLQARLSFEIGEYEKSIELYKKLPVLGRLGGQSLREMAWAHYHLGNYAETLGLIKTLKAPYYQQSLMPEVFLLEVLTLRKLCHYESVRVAAREFQSRYGSAVEHIKARRRMQDSLVLVNMAFDSAALGSRIEMVSQARAEKKAIQEIDGMPKDLSSELSSIYEQYEQDSRLRLDLALGKELRSIADQLLVQADQIQLVDYLSGLDAFRLNAKLEKRDYQAASSVAGSFQTLFWPVNAEYWWDELKNYRVQVSDRCAEVGR